MKLKIHNSYGSCTFENESIKLYASEIKNCLVSYKGKEGYVRELGSQNIHEHGYSATETIFGVITTEFEVIQLPYSGDIEILQPENILIKDKPKTLLNTNKNIDGFGGKFTYDL